MYKQCNKRRLSVTILPVPVKWLQAAHIKRWWTVRQKEIQMKSILIQTYLVALPIVLGYIVWLLKQQKKSRDANSKGTMLLLRVQLIEYHAKYTRIGEIPSYAYQNFCEMYDAYHALGGNGMVTKMKHEIEEIHIGKGDKSNEELEGLD
jgi:hypothetical protein